MPTDRTIDSPLGDCGLAPIGIHVRRRISGKLGLTELYMPAYIIA